MSIKKLILCGDSWAWGYELVDPSVEPIPVAMKMASPVVMKMKDFENMDPWNIHQKPENLQYRLQKRYGGLLANKMNIPDVVDLSLPGAGNDYIERQLLTYLGQENYLNGTNDPSEIFVSIGWSSPERREFTLKDNTPINYGPWFSIYKYGTDYVDEFLKLYMTYFNSEKESAIRYFNQVLTVQSLLKSLNIKFIMHQAFYDGMHWRKLEDLHAKAKSLNNLTQAEVNIWEAIDDRTFLNKDFTAAHYLRSKKEVCFYKEHPNERGHQLLAEYFYSLIKLNKII